MGATYATVARSLGAAALVVAVVLPVALPHLPTRFLLAGLGRADGVAGAGGSVGFSQSLNLAADLSSRSSAPVLTFRTNDPSPPPLRVSVSTTYRGGEWRPQREDLDLVNAGSSPEIPLPEGLSPDVSRKRYQMNIATNVLRQPNLAAPYPLAGGDLHGVRWGLDPQTQTALVDETPRTYEVSYYDLDPSPGQLERASAQDGADARRPALPARRRPFGRARGRPRRAAAQGGRHALRARAGDPGLPAHQRRVHLLPDARAGQGRLGPTGRPRPDQQLPGDQAGLLRPVRHGDDHDGPRRRHPGPDGHRVPARQRDPGRVDGDRRGRARLARALPRRRRLDPLRADTRRPQRCAADLRRRPAGGQPGHRRRPRAIGQPTDTARPSNPKQDVLDRVDDAREDPIAALPVTPAAEPSLLDRLPRGWALGLLAVLAGLLGGLVVPTAAAWHRRSRRRTASNPAEVVEAEWESLTGRLADLGMPAPPSRTPRQLREFYGREAFLDEDAAEALGRVVQTLERSRYARPSAQALTIEPDAERVLRAVAVTRRKRDRVRAVLWPGSGVTQVRDIGRGLSLRLQAPGRALGARVRRLRGV